MKKLFLIIFIFLLNLYAEAIPELAKRLNLQAGTKAIIQWERVFSSQRHLKKYKLDNISFKRRERLKAYLIAHAADSEQPIVPGL